MSPLQLASLTHDMKTPLSAIALYNSLLSEMAPDDPDRETCHAVIANQVDRLARMARSVLAEWTPGKLVVDVSSVIEECVGLFAGLHPEYRFVADMDDSLPSVHGDRDALMRAISNLLDNAVKYSSPHTITVSAATLPGEGLEITVRDQGPGIAPAHLDSVCDAGYRANPAISGHGLGLATVCRMVRSLGGRLVLKSTPAAGTEVRIQLSRHNTHIHP